MFGLGCLGLWQMAVGNHETSLKVPRQLVCDVISFTVPVWSSHRKITYYYFIPFYSKYCIYDLAKHEKINVSHRREISKDKKIYSYYH